MTLWLRPVSLFLATRSCATDSFACQGTPRQIPHGVKAVCQASPGNPHTPTRKGTCGLLGTDKAGVHFALIQRWIPFFSTPFFLCVCVCVCLCLCLCLFLCLCVSLSTSRPLYPPPSLFLEKVRNVCIRAIGSVVQFGESELLDEFRVALAAKTMDHNPNVRKSLYVVRASRPLLCPCHCRMPQPQNKDKDNDRDKDKDKDKDKRQRAAWFTPRVGFDCALFCRLQAGG